jgi:hypothetical protein
MNAFHSPVCAITLSAAASLWPVGGAVAGSDEDSLFVKADSPAEVGESGQALTVHDRVAVFPMLPPFEYRGPLLTLGGPVNLASEEPRHVSSIRKITVNED